LSANRSPQNMARQFREEAAGFAKLLKEGGVAIE
jgi:hypothetical protein